MENSPVPSDAGLRQPPPRGFAEAEFAARTRCAQDAMSRAGMAGILLTTEPDVRYFTGFHTPFWQSPTRPWYVFLPERGRPVAVIPSIGADLMQTTWVEDIRTWNAPDALDDGIGLLSELLAPIMRAGGVIGLPKGQETHLRMPLCDFERLRETLDGAEFADATGLLRQQRMVKSPAEIAKLRHVCAIASATFDAVSDIAREGLPLDALFRAFRREALSLGADDVPYLVGGAGPGGYGNVIAPASGRPLARGDILMLDTGIAWDGHFSDFDRNWAILDASGEARRAHERLWRATEAGIDAARPGATCRDVFHAIAALLGDTGERGAVGRFGHGLGTQLTEWPSIAPWDDTVIEENMVLTIEPSLTLGAGRIMVHEEVVLIGAQAGELLSRRAPPDLPILGATWR